MVHSPALSQDVDNSQWIRSWLKVTPRDLWSMALCPGGGWWWVVSLGGLSWNQYCLIALSFIKIGLSLFYWYLSSLPTQAILWSCDSMKYRKRQKIVETELHSIARWLKKKSYFWAGSVTVSTNSRLKTHRLQGQLVRFHHSPPLSQQNCPKKAPCPFPCLCLLLDAPDQWDHFQTFLQTTTVPSHSEFCSGQLRGKLSCHQYQWDFGTRTLNSAIPHARCCPCRVCHGSQGSQLQASSTYSAQHQAGCAAVCFDSL